MSNPITVGLSGITKRIFAGRSKPSKLAPGVREFVGEIVHAEWEEAWQHNYRE